MDMTRLYAAAVASVHRETEIVRPGMPVPEGGRATEYRVYGARRGVLLGEGRTVCAAWRAAAESIVGTRVQE